MNCITTHSGELVYPRLGDKLPYIDIAALTYATGISFIRPWGSCRALPPYNERISKTLICLALCTIRTLQISHNLQPLRVINSLQVPQRLQEQARHLLLVYACVASYVLQTFLLH